MIPGEWLLAAEPVEFNAGRPTAKLSVRNTGALTIQVGSHYHFFEANRALDFDRRRALGMRLNIPSGQAIRFDPGEEREVELVPIGGTGRILGFNGLVNGALGDEQAAERILRRANDSGFHGAGGASTAGRTRKAGGSR